MTLKHQNFEAHEQAKLKQKELQNQQMRKTFNGRPSEY